MKMFNLIKLRFYFQPEKGTQIAGYVGNYIKSKVNFYLKDVICTHRDANTCEECPEYKKCGYTYLLNTPPPPNKKEYKTLTRIPRPFIMEFPADEHLILSPEHPLIFNLILMGDSMNYLKEFIMTFQRIGKEGLGFPITPFIITRVEILSFRDEKSKKIYDFNKPDLDIKIPQSYIIKFPFKNMPEVNNYVKVNFVTPLRIKHQNNFLRRPLFFPFIKALLRRIHILSHFIGNDSIKIDLEDLLNKARFINLSYFHLKYKNLKRYKIIKGKEVGFGGLVGEVEYEGDIKPFAPYLLLGEYIHIGKSTLFGLGKFTVSFK